MSSEDILAQITDKAVRAQVAEGWRRDELNRKLNAVTGGFLPASTPMPFDDVGQILKAMPYTSTPTVFSERCYICRDPEFAQMGLPLCYKCLACEGHVPADDPVCDDCDADQQELFEAQSVSEGAESSPPTTAVLGLADDWDDIF